MDLPPYRDSMAVIFRRAHNAFRTHWKMHDNKAPLKLVLTPSQADDLHDCQVLGQVAFPGVEPPRRDEFNGRPVVITESTVGEIVAHDGTVTPLSDYDSI